MSNFYRVRQLWMKAVAVSFVASLAAAAAAQEFRVDQPDDKAKQFGTKAKRCVTDSTAYNAERANFDAYFQQYYFPAMTRTSPSELAELGKLRLDLFKTFLWASNNPELQQSLTKMAYPWALRVAANLENLPPNPVVANPSYHPAVRYNAILVLGLLDSEYAIDGGGNARPPKPLPAATNALSSIVSRATFPPPVILGAIIGLERHAKYQSALAPGAADKISAALVTLLKHQKPIQEMDPTAFGWLQLRAARALAQLGSLGPNNAAHDAIITLINNSKELDDRCAAAALLEKFKAKYEGAKVDVPATSGAFLKLAHDLAVEETKRAEDFENLGAGGSAFVSARDQRTLANDPNAQQELYPRRHVLARLVELRAGLRAVQPAMTEDAKKNVDAILAAVQPAIDVASDEEKGARAVANAILNMADAINEVAPGAEPAAEDEFSAGAAAPAATPATATPPVVTPAADAPAATPDAEVAPAATLPAETPAAPE